MEQWEQTREMIVLQAMISAAVEEKRICRPIPVSLRLLLSRFLPAQSAQQAPTSSHADNPRRVLAAAS
jgi:hypothetical protein